MPRDLWIYGSSDRANHVSLENHFEVVKEVPKLFDSNSVGNSRDFSRLLQFLLVAFPCG